MNLSKLREDIGTEEPGMLQSMGSQRVLVTKQQQRGSVMYINSCPLTLAESNLIS